MKQFFNLTVLNSAIFSKYQNWIVLACRREDSWEMDLSDSVGWKNLQHWIWAWCGGICFFIKTGGVLFLKLRGKRGMFFYWAGYWRVISIIGDLTCQYLKYSIITDTKMISQPMIHIFSVWFSISFNTYYSIALKQIYIKVLRQHIFQTPIHQIRDLFPDL